MRAESPLKLKIDPEEKKLLEISGTSTGFAAIFVAGRWCDEPGVLCAMKIRPVGRGVRTPAVYILCQHTRRSQISLQGPAWSDPTIARYRKHE